jgi:hypothetical protein
MKRTTLIALYFLCGTAYAEQANSWFHPLPQDMNSASKTVQIPEERFFEVTASKEATAEYWLTEKTYISQTSKDFDFFGQHNFHCPSSTKPYLVRAVYENGGTGHFNVERRGSALLISHMSLGGASKMFRTALMVCLDFQPTEVYHEIGGDI